MDDLGETAKSILAVIVAVSIGIAILNPVFGALFTASEDINGGTTETGVLLDNDVGDLAAPYVGVENLSVEQTLGTAAKLDGNPGDAITATNLDLAVDPHRITTCTWVAVDAGATTQKATIVQTDSTLTIQYNGTAGTYEAVLYDAIERETYVADIAATNPDALTHVCAQHNGSTLTVARNASATTTVQTTSANAVTDAATDYGALNGTLEETRVFNASLSTAQRQALIDNPARDLPGVDRTARIMYDTRASGTFDDVPVYTYGGNQVLADSAASIVAGFSGDTVTSSDYTVWNNDITATDGGVLDGAPVVFVDFDHGAAPLLYRITGIGGAVLVVLIVGLLAYAAEAVSGELGGY